MRPDRHDHILPFSRAATLVEISKDCTNLCLKRQDTLCKNVQVHDEWPALAFESPTSYNVLPKSTKEEIGNWIK